MRFHRIILTILLLLCLSPRGLAQQVSRQCHIVDDASGEELPYVSVYVSPENSTIANHDGDFLLVADSLAEVRLSYVGYEPLYMKVGELPPTVRMKVLSRTLHQLTVMPVDGILIKVKDRLNKEYSRRQGRKAQYFCRLTSSIADRDELTEAFLEAKSAVNLRELVMLSGRRGQMTRYGMLRPQLSDVNLQHALELGPMTAERNFWRWHVLPLPVNATREYINQHYRLGCEVIGDGLTDRVYCIDLQRKEGNDEKGMLLGQLYVDAKTYQPLRFEGEVTDMYIDVIKRGKKVSQPVDMKVYISYTQRNGFTEVEDISCEIGKGELHTQTILHNVTDMKIKFKGRKKGEVQENMLSAIDAAGFDSTLWKHAGIVLRTAYEEKLARQQMQMDSTAVTQHTGNARLDEMIDRLRVFGQRLPQEKVYLHLDNSCYFLGDTIWYAAYLRRTNDDRPSDISNVLYVELLNNDGYVMERKVLQMKDGRGHGNFYLDPQYYSGFYELRAYTRWQLNWGGYEREHETHHWFMNQEKEREFYQDYDKLYSRVVPVYDQPLDSSGFHHDMTLRPMRRYFKKDPDKRELQLTLYPEGGNLVEGLPCRVAFEAGYNDGEWVEGELRTGDGQAFPTVHRGRGVFTVVPDRKNKGQLEFLTGSGERVKGKWPEVQESGVVLSAQRLEEGAWEIHIAMTGDLSPDSLALTVMHEGMLGQVYNIQQRSEVFTLQEKDLPVGVNQLTVFDTQGRVWADRLFFVSQAGMGEATLRIEGMKDEYRPFEQITLDIQSTLRYEDEDEDDNENDNDDDNDDDGEDSINHKPSTLNPNPSSINPKPLTLNLLSLSVRDAMNQDYLYDTGNLLTEMLLGSEVKGFIPKPEWYFEQDDEEHRRALDLLMLTQGWRRFVWHDMAVSGAWELTHPDEKSIVVDGVVEPYVTTEEIREYMNLNSSNQGGSALTYEEAAAILRSEKLKKAKALTLHGEVVDPVTNEAVVNEMELSPTSPRFRLKMPDFEGKAYFFLSAADLAKNRKKDVPYTWIQMAWAGEDMPADRSLLYRMQMQTLQPDFMPYITQPYPRYAKRYTWYQNHLAPAPRYEGTRGRRFSDGSIELNELSVTARRNGQRRFKDSEPAFMVDAYEAFNNAMDAGLATDHEGIARSYIGDLGLDDPYAWDVVFFSGGGSEPRRTSRIKLRLGLNLERRFDVQGLASADFEAASQEDLDTLYHRDQLWSMERLLENVQPGELRYYMKTDDHGQPSTTLDIFKLEKFIIYTDYCPRLIGDGRYEASNLPETKVAAYPYADGGRRPFYRDRRYVIQGFSVCEDFYHPDYSRQSPPEDLRQDYRRTLYWNPSLMLDETGHARVTLYNCGRTTRLNVTAEGLSAKGDILTGSEER